MLVVLIGGTLRRETASLVGGDAPEGLRRFNIRKGFFGAHGISLAEGLTDVSLAEAEVKRPVVAMCRQAIAVLDATKWGRAGLASFASLDQVHRVITDEYAPADLVAPGARRRRRGCSRLNSKLAAGSRMYRTQLLSTRILAYPASKE